MKVMYFVRSIILVTVLAVLYINLQVKIYILAYRGKVQQWNIEQLAEVNGRVKNDVLRLRSSDHIGRELLGNDDGYQFVGKNRIVEISAVKATFPEMLVTGAQKTEGFFSRMALALSSR